MTIEERIDTALARIAQVGAHPKRIVLGPADLSELRGKAEHKGVPIVAGEVAGQSFIKTDHAPSGDNTDFAI
jgi:hypothetical protein